MMGTILILATEAAEEKGFGLNLDIFETNLINLAILVGLLVYFGSKVLGKILSDRKSKIAQAISEAEDRQKKAAAALAEQQKNLAQAQATAERVRKEADERAQAAKAAIATQTEKDIERLKETAAQDLSSEQARVISELRQRIVALAMERAEAQLKDQLNDSTQQTLIERSIAQLGGR
jgi:F-type H+-transporting ATPase subunit b